MEPKQQPPYPLRMPLEMRSHYEDLAEASKRSLNAEIVGALQETQSLRDRVQSLEHELRELRQGREQHAKMFSSTIDALTKVNGMLGYYLKTVSEMVPKKGAEGQRMMELIGAIGHAVHSSNYASAVDAAAELVKLGESNELLSREDKSTNTPEQVADRLKKKPGLLD